MVYVISIIIIISGIIASITLYFWFINISVCNKGKIILSEVTREHLRRLD